MDGTPVARVSDAQPRDILKHISALDGVRGLAIALVLCNHLLWSSTSTGSSVMDFVVKLRGAAWVGVDLFFALSGFLITGILFESLTDAHYFKNFYVRRVLRIFPLYYGVVLVLFALFHAAPSADKRPLVLILAYLQNTPLWWHGLAGGSRALVDLTGHFWSLAVEEQFYLVWPLLVFLVKDRRRLLWLAGAFALSALLSRWWLVAHGAPLEAAYKLTVCRADSLLGGAWLALMVRGPARGKVLRFAGPVFWVAAAACVALAWWTGNFDWEKNPAVDVAGFSLLAVASTALIALALRAGSWTSRAFSGAFLRFLGKYSYGIYVFHQLVGVTVDNVLLGRLREHIASKALVHVAAMAIVLGITIPLAMLSFEFYEKPFLKLKRFFNYAHSRSAAV